MLRIAQESSIRAKALDIDVRLTERGALRRQVADGLWVEAVCIRDGRYFHTAPLWKIRNVAIVADIPHKLEWIAGHNAFQNIGTVFYGAAIDGSRFKLQGIDFLVLFRHRLAPLVVGSRLPTKRRLITVERKGILSVAEPRNIFRKMSGGLGHKVAKLPEDLSANFLVFVVFGPLKHVTELGVEVTSFV